MKFFDHIDIDTARQRGVLVSNTPGVLTDDTADMAMALMLRPIRAFSKPPLAYFGFYALPWNVIN